MSDEKEYYYVKCEPWGNGEAYIVMYHYKGKDIWNEIFAEKEKAQEKCDKLNNVLSKIKRAGEHNG